MTNSAVFQRSVSPYTTRATGIHERPPMTSTSVARPVPLTVMTTRMKKNAGTASIASVKRMSTASSQPPL